MSKAKENADYFFGFRDKRWHGDAVLTDDMVTAFHLFESRGKRALSGEQLRSIEPLLNGKAIREITWKQVVSSMVETWAGGDGWAMILLADIEMNFRENPRNRRWIRELIALYRKVSEIGMIEFIQQYTGFSEKEKTRYLKFREETLGQNKNNQRTNQMSEANPCTNKLVGETDKTITVKRSVLCNTPEYQLALKGGLRAELIAAMNGPNPIKDIYAVMAQYDSLIKNTLDEGTPPPQTPPSSKADDTLEGQLLLLNGALNMLDAEVANTLAKVAPLRSPCCTVKGTPPEQGELTPDQLAPAVREVFLARDNVMKIIGLLAALNDQLKV